MTMLSLVVIQVGLMYFILRVICKNIVSVFMLSIATVFSVYGLLSFGFALGGWEVSLFRLAYASFFILIALCAILAYFQGRPRDSAIFFGLPVINFKNQEFFLIFLASLALAVFNFGPEFTPSSMTGDPPRHFARVLQFQFESAAALWKPIYPLAAAVWLQMTPFLDPVQSFTAFNVLLLAGIGLVLCQVIALTRPTLSGYGPFCVACIALAGYPQFALQYGYFALNLAALFYFATLVALLSWADSRNPGTYVLSMALGAGVMLTHGYLLPPLLIMQSAVYLHTKFYRNDPLQSKGQSPEWVWLMVSLVWYLVLSSISNGWTSIERFEGQFDTLKLRGLVNESFFLNISPFLPLAALSLFLRDRSRQEKLLTICTGLLLLYSTLLFVLGLLGLLAPYYTNRIQVILLPLLILLNAIVVRHFSIAFNFNSNLVFVPLLLACLSLYLFYRSAPLNFTKETFLGLLRKDENVYFENPVNAGYSPLQLTDFDVRFLKMLRSDYRTCFDRPLAKVAVLGTDHSVQWIEHIAGIQPSLYERQDGYIDFAGYRKNFNLWHDSAQERYIVVASHFDFWNRNDLIAKILASASLVCAGDTIKIYRKNIQRSVAVK